MTGPSGFKLLAQLLIMMLQTLLQDQIAEVSFMLYITVLLFTSLLFIRDTRYCHLVALL